MCLADSDECSSGIPRILWNIPPRPPRDRGFVLYCMTHAYSVEYPSAWHRLVMTHDCTVDYPSTRHRLVMTHAYTVEYPSTWQRLVMTHTYTVEYPSTWHSLTVEYPSTWHRRLMTHAYVVEYPSTWQRLVMMHAYTVKYPSTWHRLVVTHAYTVEYHRLQFFGFWILTSRQPHQDHRRVNHTVTITLHRFKKHVSSLHTIMQTWKNTSDCGTANQTTARRELHLAMSSGNWCDIKTTLSST